MVIGEAANHLSEEISELNPEIPRAKTIGARNLTVHGYHELRMQIIWEIIQGHIADLEEKISKRI